MSDKDEGSRMKAEPEMKPCPFCGSSSIHVIGNLDVQCQVCDAYGPEKPTREEAVEAWNTRHLWQPIETAPKDGSPVVALCDNAPCRILFQEGVWIWFKRARSVDGGWEWAKVEPTHWLPLMDAKFAGRVSQQRSGEEDSTEAVENVPANGLRLTEPRSGEGGA